MSDDKPNTFALPPGTEQPRRSGLATPQKLHAVATAQKSLLICILVYLGAAAAALMSSSDTRLVASGLLALTSLIAAGCVHTLAKESQSASTGVLLGLLTLVPGVGLIVLLSVNATATRVLREGGVEVGLFGADLSQF